MIRTAWLVVLLTAFAVVPALAATPASTPPQRLITIDAEDASTPNVLKILAEKGSLNLITGPGVSNGRLTLHIRDVPVDEAVDLIVRAAGLGYERIGNSVLVAEPAALKEQTGLSSYVVDLKYADATEVQAALKSLNAQIQVDRGGNRLVVVTNPRVFSEIEQIVQAMDVPLRQVMLEARIVEVSTNAAKRIGIDWDLLNHQGFVVIEGPPHGQAVRGGFPDSINYFRSSPDKPNLFQTQAPFYREGYAWRTAIDLMIQDGNARVLANPKLATLNGHPADMLVGQRIPFTVTGVVTTGAGGGATNAQLIEREEVGIKLRITPLINADGYITTDIHPEVSTVVGFRGANSDLPVVATRQASTTVRLKDGNTVIIGGLLSEQKTTTVTKVPLLGDIPGIGPLFQHRGSTSDKTDLVIEITPHILPEQP